MKYLVYMVGKVVDLFDRTRIYYNRVKTNKELQALGEGSVVKYPNHIGHGDLVSIGANTVILEYSRIQVFPELTNVQGSITIGNHCYFGYRNCLLAGADIVIGDNNVFANDFCIVTYNHGTDPESEIPYMDQKLDKAAPVTIGNGNWFGNGSMVMPGVTVGDKCVIGAGSIVTKDIPSYSMVAGNPARVIKQYDFDSKEWRKV